MAPTRNDEEQEDNSRPWWHKVNGYMAAGPWRLAAETYQRRWARVIFFSSTMHQALTTLSLLFTGLSCSPFWSINLLSKQTSLLRLLSQKSLSTMGSSISGLWETEGFWTWIKIITIIAYPGTPSGAASGAASGTVSRTRTSTRHLCPLCFGVLVVI